MARRGGVSALLAAFRLVLGNPIARTVLMVGMKDAVCRYGGEAAEAPIVNHALALYAGEMVSCPIAVRFVADLIRILVRVGVAIMGGRDDEVKEALRDPALRKGVATVMKGIAMYGVTVPQKLPAPFLIVWNFTNMCNFRCKHCYQRADRPLPNELSFREKLRVIEELDKVGVPAIALSGGEPTIHPEYLYVIKAAARKGMYTAVATNGWRYADVDELRRAKEAGLRYVEVSVDSANPRKHDEFRGVEGAWERAVKALENAVKLGLSHAMAVTLTRMNVDEIDEILDLAESIGVKRVVFFNFVPTGRAVNIAHADLDPVTRERVMRRLYREMHKRRMEIVTTAPQYGRVVIQMSGGREAAPTHFVARGDPATTALAEFVGGCGAGRIYAAIQPDGTLTPCVFMPIPRGNLRERSFWEIWSSDPLMNALRDKNNLKGFCGKCPYRFVCGGCRARAYGYFKDPLAPDPGCIFNLREWEEVKRKVAQEAYDHSLQGLEVC